jgi:predicted hydrolase (HD superfamily)
MRWYARHFQERGEAEIDEMLWAITGLLHDFDYEKYPDLSAEGHPIIGCRILKELGYPEQMIDAILGHAHCTGVARESLLAKTLFACDELAGFVTASVFVRPDRSIHTLSVQSVKKRMKDKAFARGVSREDILLGAQELNIDLDSHIANVISALKVSADELGLVGVPG